MITVPSQLKAELSNDVDNFVILLRIHTPPTETDFFIATREGEWNIPEEGLGIVYFEDLGLNIKSLKESIDFKTKKIKMSSANITLSNLKPSIDSQRFSDRVNGTLLNAKVSISLSIVGRTHVNDLQTDNSTVDLAYLKVTRYKHDEKTITLQCDELLADALYQELPNPDHTLYGDMNTYETYNEKRVPILYGHLKEAPAISYITDDNKTRIIPDSTYFSGAANGIAGIKRMKDLPAFTHDNFDRQES